MLPQSSCLQAGFVLAHSLFLARMLPGACCFAQHDAMDHVCAFGALSWTVASVAYSHTTKSRGIVAPLKSALSYDVPAWPAVEQASRLWIASATP